MSTHMQMPMCLPAIPGELRICKRCILTTGCARLVTGGALGQVVPLVQATPDHHVRITHLNRRGSTPSLATPSTTTPTIIPTTPIPTPSPCPPPRPLSSRSRSSSNSSSSNSSRSRSSNVLVSNSSNTFSVRAWPAAQAHQGAMIDD